MLGLRFESSLRSFLESPKGFSLIELTIAVAIVGVLASIGTQAYRNFVGKSRQAEAKSNLATLYSVEKVFKSEWQVYQASFRKLGLQPEGRLRYNFGFSGGGSTLPVGYTNMYGVTVDVDFNAFLYCISKPCLIIDGPVLVAWMVSLSGAPCSNETFLAMAVADIDGDTTLDRWTIDHTKTLVNLVNDLDD